MVNMRLKAIYNLSGIVFMTTPPSSARRLRIKSANMHPNQIRTLMKTCEWIKKGRPCAQSLEYKRAVFPV